MFLWLQLAADRSCWKFSLQLRRLLSGTDGASRVMGRGEPLPEFAWQCPLPSLPMAFGTELNTIPARIPYVHPDRALVEAWRQRFQGNTRRIGLAWGGNPTHHRDRLRVTRHDLSLRFSHRVFRLISQVPLLVAQGARRVHGLGWDRILGCVGNHVSYPARARTGLGAARNAQVGR